MKEVKEFSIKEKEEILRIVDDRGTFNNFPIEQFKRVYVITNHNKNTIRGFHFHPKESILLYCLKGAFKTIIYPKEAKLVEDLKVEVISEGQFVEVPANYGNGHVDLKEGSILLCFATLSLHEVVNEEIKEPYDKFGKDIWEVKPR